MAGVGDHHFHRRAVFAERAANAKHPQQAALHGLGRVVDQVGQRAADGFRIGQNRGQTRFQVALHRDAIKTSGEQRQSLFRNLVHIARARLRRGKLRQRRKLIDQRTQCAHAAQDHFTALANHVGRVRLAAIQMLADPLRRQRNRGERILDFVRHALRHFLPRQLSLRPQQFRRVLHHQHGSLLSVAQIKPSAGHGQVYGTAPRMKFNLGGGRPHAMSAANHRGQLVRAFGRQRRSNILAPHACVIAPSHQHAKRAIGLQHGPGAIQRDHAAGDRLHNGLQLAPPLLDGQVGRCELRRRGLRQLPAGLQIGCHVVERAHQLRHFAGRDQFHALLIFAGPDFVHGIGQRRHRPRDLLRQEHGQPHA